MSKKGYYRIGAMVLMSAAVILFLYPLIHEAGHYLAAVAVGARITEASLFPRPHISFSIAGLSSFELFLIAQAGSFLLAGCLLIPLRRFGYLYFLQTALAMLILCNALQEGIVCCLFVSGYPVDFPDDAAQLLLQFPATAGSLLLGLTAQTVIAAAYFVLTRPLDRMVLFLEMGKKGDLRHFDIDGQRYDDFA